MRYILTYVGLVLLFCFIFASIGMNPSLGVGLSMILASLSILLIVILKEKNIVKLNKAIVDEDAFSFNSTSGTLTLKKRSSLITQVVSVQGIINQDLVYHPSEYVFTSATVGGITTGGVTDVGNYYSVDNSLSGKHQLVYKNGGKETKIEKIIITNDELLSLAKKSPIMSPFFEDTNIFVLKHKKKNNDLKTDTKSLSSQQIMFIAKQAFIEAQLTKDECNDVLKWMSD